MSWEIRATAELDRFRFEVDLEMPGLVTAIIGPNGSGKTTLLRMFLSNDAQRLSIGGEVTGQPVEQRNVAYVPQHAGLFPHLTVMENVAFGVRRKSRSSDARQAATEMLERFGCGDLAGRNVDQLSGGERQKVALARALVVEPALLLLDEPLASLDVLGRVSMREFIASALQSRTHPTILVSHDQETVAALCDAVVVLEEGRVLAAGQLEEISRHHSPFVQAFFR